MNIGIVVEVNVIGGKKRVIWIVEMKKYLWFGLDDGCYKGTNAHGRLKKKDPTVLLGMGTYTGTGTESNSGSRGGRRRVHVMRTWAPVG